MKIRYFDLGLHNGLELQNMQHFLPTITNDYEIYGFEAAPTHYNNYCKQLVNDKTKIYNVAISDKHNSKTNLYFAPNELGHSIHSSKFNVSKDTYWSVSTIKFSDWIKENNIELEKSFNILKINIEGAEWEFFNDIINTGLNKNIHIYCGAGGDVCKIKNFVNSGILKVYNRLLSKNNIELQRWVLPQNSWAPKNCNLHSLIRNKLKNIKF